MGPREDDLLQHLGGQDRDADHRAGAQRQARPAGARATPITNAMAATSDHTDTPARISVALVDRPRTAGRVGPRARRSRPAGPGRLGATSRYDHAPTPPGPCRTAAGRAGAIGVAPTEGVEGRAAGAWRSTAGSAMPLRTANRAAWVRSLTRSLASTLDTWVLTVFSDTNSSAGQLAVGQAAAEAGEHLALARREPGEFGMLGHRRRSRRPQATAPRPPGPSQRPRPRAPASARRGSPRGWRPSRAAGPASLSR